jgi:hypothetical protein
MKMSFIMTINIHPYAWAIGPSYVCIDVEDRRLGEIPFNHFNQPYRVTDSV